MNRRLAIAAGLVGGAAALVVGTLLGDAVTGDQSRQGPTRLVPVAGPGPDPGPGAEVASLPVFPPVQAAVDPDHDLDLPGPTRDQHPAGFEEFALGEGVEAVGAEEPDASQSDDPPPTLERVNPIFVDSDSDHALLRDLAALAGEPDGADDGQPIAVIVDHVGGPLIDREALQRAFTDACVLDSTRCPIGVVAQVLGPLESSAVPLQVHLTVIDDYGLRCDFGEPAPFDLPLLVTTTHPADLTVTYRLPPDDFGQVLSSTLAATAPTGNERALWEDRVDRDAVAAEWPQGWVQQCLVLPALLADQVLYTVEVHAVDAFGASAQATASLQPPAFSDRPLPRVMYRSDNRMALAVPLEDDEHGFVWPIEVGRFPDTECADIEAERLQGLRVPDNDHPDPLIALALRQSQQRVDLAGDRLAVFDLPYREGRRYIVCAWVYRLGSRSFDTIDITNRYRYEVYTPNRYRVHVTLVEMHVSSATPGTRVSLHISGCPETVARTPFQLDGPGLYPLGIPLCDSDGAEMPRTLPLSLRYTVGDADFFGAFGAIPIDTTEGCDIGVHEVGCALRSRMEMFDLFLPLTRGCDLCHVDGWIRVRVDYAASTGQGTGSWVVGLEGTFPSAPDAGPGPPQLDTTSLYLAPVYDGVGGIVDVAFDTNHPTIAGIRLTPSDAPPACSAKVLSSPLGSRHNVRFRDLCPDVFYWLDVKLTDQDGVSADYEHPSWFTRTRGQQRSALWIKVTHITTDPTAAAARCAAMDEVTDLYEGSDLDSTCWTGVGYGWQLDEARWYAVSSGESRRSSAPQCIDQTETLSGLVEHRPGATLTVQLTVTLFLRPDCGAPEPLSSIPQVSPQATQLVERSLARYGFIQGRFQVPTGEWEPGESVILGHIVVHGLDFVVEASVSPFPEGFFETPRDG